MTELEGGEEGNLASFEEDMDIGDEFVMPSPRRASVEEDEGGGGSGNTYPTRKVDRFIESYPGEAGKALRQSKTQFKVWLENQRDEEKIPWDPFASEQEWALGMWLLKNVSLTSTDEFLKLPIIREVLCPFFFLRYSPSFIRSIARKTYPSIIPIPL